jgi:hypothetical protein
MPSDAAHTIPDTASKLVRPYRFARAAMVLTDAITTFAEMGVSGSNSALEDQA